MNHARVLEGIAAGRPLAGPRDVHVDVTHACNLSCVTCWDHSPLLREPRSPAWKRRRMSLERFTDVVDQLERLGSVRGVVLSGMGEPLIHPHIHEMIAAVHRRRWRLTLISNLVDGDVERLSAGGVDAVLAGIHGATPETYAAFHPGATERQFFAVCGHLRQLVRAGVRVRHVHVICRDNADELVEMVRFGALFRADRVNLKLASLARGTEARRITAEQRRWLATEGIPRAREAAQAGGVATNLDLFERQLRTGGGATAPIDRIGCFMGYVYARVTADGRALYCCNDALEVDSLEHASFEALWTGEAWQGLRDRLRTGDFPAGCERCGKLEQNVKWSRRFRRVAGDDAWRAATGAQEVA